MKHKLTNQTPKTQPKKKKKIWFETKDCGKDKVPGCLGGVLLDGEAGPSEDLAGGEVLDLDGGGDDADEADGVAEVLLPRNLRWLRVRHVGLGLLFHEGGRGTLQQRGFLPLLP